MGCFRQTMVLFTITFCMHYQVHKGLICVSVVHHNIHTVTVASRINVIILLAMHLILAMLFPTAVWPFSPCSCPTQRVLQILSWNWPEIVAKINKQCDCVTNVCKIGKEVSRRTHADQGLCWSSGRFHLLSQLYHHLKKNKN